jgi:hypothetical protein
LISIKTPWFSLILQVGEAKSNLFLYLLNCLNYQNHAEIRRFYRDQKYTFKVLPFRGKAFSLIGATPFPEKLSE